MEKYINNYDNFENSIVYDFNLGAGGIGDCIKFFMFILDSCMKDNIRLYYKQNNIEIEKYLKLKYDKMYTNDNQIIQLKNVKIAQPQMYYSTFNYNFNLEVKDVFFFTDEVIDNSKLLFPTDIVNYISIHLHLGDNFLETNIDFIVCKNDIRSYNEENIYNFINSLTENENIFFCCDNNSYKLKIKEKYKNIIVTNCDIGHTSLLNTTSSQTLNSITEFYILTNSNKIIAASYSGFSYVAAKFNNIPLINLS